MAFIWPQSADLVFVRGHGFIADAIEDVSHSKYDHVALVVNNELLIEAQGFRKVGYQYMSAYKGQMDLYRCESLTSRDRRAILHEARAKIGERYDYALIALEYFRLAMGITIPWYEGHRVICSTLAWDAFMDGVGINLTPGIKFPSPGDEARSKKIQKIGEL